MAYRIASGSTKCSILPHDLPLFRSRRVEEVSRLRDKQEGQREVFQPEGYLKESFDRAFAKVASRLPELNRLSISFVRLPASERNVSFVTCSRARGEYQFYQTVLKSGQKAISLALIDALAQTKSISGKCDLDYQNELIGMVLECVGE